MFCVQLYGKWARWGQYNLYFEALKGLLLKKCTLFFFLIFAEKVTLLSQNIIKLIPLESSTSKYKKSASPCDYTKVICIFYKKKYLNMGPFFKKILGVCHENCDGLYFEKIPKNGYIYFFQ